MVSFRLSSLGLLAIYLLALLILVEQVSNQSGKFLIYYSNIFHLLHIISFLECQCTF